MKKIIILSGIILLLLLIHFYREGFKTRREVAPMVDDMKLSNVTITTVYDNREYDKRLQTGWGFSSLIKVKDKTILFDTGGDSEILLNNMKILRMNPKTIDTIFLSHIHGDHTGGLTGILEENSKVTVYLPESFPRSFKNRIKSYKSNVVEVSSPIKIYDGIYSTGELGTWIKEQSLIIKTEKGLVVITGCAHPGIVNIVKRAKELTKENVYLVMGGFHLGGASNSEIDYIIKSFKELEVEKVAPSHCTGDRAIESFKKEYENDFIENGVGKTIIIE